MADGLKMLDRLAGRRRFGMRPGLDAIRALLAALGDPQDSLRCVHVAGTNGKGAVTAMLDAVLRAAGWRVARYTSPHLVSLNERFFLDGAPAPQDELEAAADAVFPAVERLSRAGTEVTFFEALTAVAFVLFARRAPDVTILETGLGGRLDATNVIARPLVSVITRIGLDHCDWLGTTRAAIAAEKAGILKPGRPAVCGAMPDDAREAIRRAAAEKGCPLVEARPWTPPAGFALFGAFQEENAATAKAALDVLAAEGFAAPPEAIAEGLAHVTWPGRCQRVVRDGALYVVDGAHNPDGAAAFAQTLRLARVPRPLGLVAGFCGDKDVDGHLRTMAPLVARAWAVPIRNERTMSPEAVAARMRAAGIAAAEACPAVAPALAAAGAWARAAGGATAVCGSLFLAGEALVALDAYPWPARTPDANEPRFA